MPINVAAEENFDDIKINSFKDFYIRNENLKLWYEQNQQKQKCCGTKQ